MRRTRVIALAVLGVATLAASGCSNDSSGSVDDPAPVETAEMFSDLYGSSDGVGFLGLMSPDAQWVHHTGTVEGFAGSQVCAGEVSEARYLAATGGSVTVECGDGTGDYNASCVLAVSNVFTERRGGPERIQFWFTVDDGTITHRRSMGPDYFFGSSSDPVVKTEAAEYASWLKENHPDEAGELVRSSGVLIVDDEEKRAQHRMFINEWVSVSE